MVHVGRQESRLVALADARAALADDVVVIVALGFETAELVQGGELIQSRGRETICRLSFEHVVAGIC